jgi:hypothetical protein
MAKNNKPAMSYATPHSMDGKKFGVEAAVSTKGYKTDPNTMSAAESTPGGMPARRVSIGNMTRGPKTDGIKARGTGAATKGTISRGPMA